MPIVFLLLLGGLVAASTRRAPSKVPPKGGTTGTGTGTGTGGGATGTGGGPALPAPPFPLLPFVPAAPIPVAPRPGTSPGELPTTPAVPTTPRDPFGILALLGATPAIDALPEPQRTNVRNAIAYGTDPQALRTLAAALRSIGAGAAAAEVERAAVLLQTAGQWPEIQKLPEPYRSRAQTLIVDGLDYFTLFDLSKPFCKLIAVPDYAAIGTVPSYVTDPSSADLAPYLEAGLSPEQARGRLYENWLKAKFPGGAPTQLRPSPACPLVSDLTAFLAGLNAAGVIGGWTAEIGSAIARLQSERSAGGAGTDAISR